MEIWKDIKGYEGVYQISSEGRVKSLKRKVSCKNGSFRELQEKIVQPLFTKNGYLNLIASKKQFRETLVVHHLVAKHFIGERPEGMYVDHIDRDRTNNRVENLRYVTAQESVINRKITKLNGDMVKQIKEMMGHKPQSEIAKLFGISQAMVSSINTGRRWKSG